MLRQSFACGDWQKIDTDYLHGYLTVEQSNKLQYALIQEPKEKLQEFVRQHIEIRPGFVEFARHCHDIGIPLVIVSSGLDFYIETVLIQIGIQDTEVHCGQAAFGKEGILVSYSDPEGNTINKGFKENYLAWLRKRDNNIVYIGDGLSDLKAACNADLVFAIDHLLKLLHDNSVACNAFSDFYDLLHQIRHLQ